MFEAENRLFYKHAEAQPKKVRAYKKKECIHLSIDHPTFLSRTLKYGLKAIHLLFRMKENIAPGAAKG